MLNYVKNTILLASLSLFLTGCGQSYNPPQPVTANDVAHKVIQSTIHVLKKVDRRIHPTPSPVQKINRAVSTVANVAVNKTDQILNVARPVFVNNTIEDEMVALFNMGIVYKIWIKNAGASGSILVTAYAQTNNGWHGVKSSILYIPHGATQMFKFVWASPTIAQLASGFGGHFTAKAYK